MKPYKLYFLSLNHKTFKIEMWVLKLLLHLIWIFNMNTYFKQDLCILFLMFIMHFSWQIKWQENWVLHTYWCPWPLDHYNNNTYYLPNYGKVNADIKAFFLICTCCFNFYMFILVKLIIIYLIDHCKKKTQKPFNRRCIITTFRQHSRCIPRRSCFW